MGLEPRSSCMLGKCSITDLFAQLNNVLFKKKNILLLFAFEIESSNLGYS